MSKSEIALLREQIAQEHAASVWAMSGFASGMARHDFINARFRRMDSYHQRLSQLVGEEEAIAFVCQVFDTTPTTNALHQIMDALPVLSQDICSTAHQVITQDLCLEEQ
jgi:hypothetical protein